eukprot:Awhi_evm1s3405
MKLCNFIFLAWVFYALYFGLRILMTKTQLSTLQSKDELIQYSDSHLNRCQKDVLGSKKDLSICQKKLFITEPMFQENIVFLDETLNRAQILKNRALKEKSITQKWTFFCPKNDVKIWEAAFNFIEPITADIDVGLQ